jgi:integrase/recombinase XerD
LETGESGVLFVFLKHAIKEYEFDCRARKLGVNTIQGYMRMLHYLMNYINDLLKVFKTFFNYLKKEGHIKERPTANVKNMKQPKVKIITFTEAEIRKLLNHFSGRTFLSIRNRAILAMFFDTGMRLTEVTTLCPHQVREDHIIVHGKGNKERLVPVSPYLAKTLMQYQLARESYFEGKLPEKYLFVSHRGRRLTQEGITKFMKKVEKATGK